MTVLVDGRPADSLPVDDPAIGNGVAVFEALRTYGGRVFRLGAHLARLRASAAWFDLPCPPEELVRAELEAVLGPIGGEAALWVTLTGGGRRIVRAAPLALARVGAPVTLATLTWEAPPWLPGWVKHTNRAGWTLAARRAGVDEVLFVGADGTWTEANRSNVFVVREGALVTPPTDGRILAGVTRAALIEAAERVGLPVLEAPIGPGPFEELYVASTFKGLAPVVRLDGAALAGAGPVGGAVAAAFEDAVRDAAFVG